MDQPVLLSDRTRDHSLVSTTISISTFRHLNAYLDVKHSQKVESRKSIVEVAAPQGLLFIIIIHTCRRRINSEPVELQ